MPDTVPSSQLGEDYLVALFAHGTPPRNETAFLMPLNKPAGEDPWVAELVRAVRS
jgi:hypothetical protein